MDNESESSQDARVDELWHTLDTRQEGQLDLEALKKGLRKIDHPLKNAEELLKDVLKAVDSTGGGKIQYTDFCTFVKHAEKELWTLFKSIDVDHDNSLSREELQFAFSKAGIAVPNSKLDDFFTKVDANHDGQISFDEWRDFLLFMPADVPNLKALMSYFSATVRVNAEGDVHIGDETIESLGTELKFPWSLFRVITLLKQPRIRHRPPDTSAFSQSSFTPPSQIEIELEDEQLEVQVAEDEITPDQSQASWKSMLTAFLPKPGYFLAGGIAGIVSRTATAPLDRLKVYLITQTGTTDDALAAVKKGSPLKATKHAARPLIDAVKALWAAGGWRSLFAGNGLNVLKVMPESAIKFGSYEASKRLIAQIEGHGEPSELHSASTFIAGGLGGIISQFFVYPVDTLKFRMQSETVKGGLHGNQLIVATAKRMWTRDGIRSFYRGLPMGLVGMFPYSAIDLTTFENLKHWITVRNARIRGCHEEDAAPGNVATAFIGGFSGALGASLVYPLNLLRTRLQTQGTANHPRTYTGIVDVTRQTLKGEGVRGLFKGITPNLLKVVPAVSITYVVYENAKQVLHLS